MHIRKAVLTDLPRMLEIYVRARAFMAENGNGSQWGKTNPASEVVERDIGSGNFYVMEADGRTIGGFALIIGDDPTYAVIEDGGWHSDAPYGTIHRLASDGTETGIAKSCFDFCSRQISCLRIDTHRNNIPMQRAILRFGFRRCGIIHVADGTERIAFDYIRD